MIHGRSDREALAEVLGPLQLVDQRHRVVLERDPALALLIDEELVPTRAVRSSPLAGLERHRWTDVGPVEVLSTGPVNGEGVAVLQRLPLVRLGDLGSVHELDARPNLQGAGPPYHDEPLDAGLLGPRNQCPCRRSERRRRLAMPTWSG